MWYTNASKNLCVFRCTHRTQSEDEEKNRKNKLNNLSIRNRANESIINVVLNSVWEKGINEWMNRMNSMIRQRDKPSLNVDFFNKSNSIFRFQFSPHTRLSVLRHQCLVWRFGYDRFFCWNLFSIYQRAVFIYSIEFFSYTCNSKIVFKFGSHILIYVYFKCYMPFTISK